MQRHTFAQQVLLSSKINIYSNNQSILNSSKDVTESWTTPFNSNFILHRLISTHPTKALKVIDSYSDLLRMGFQISRQRAHAKYFAFQSVEYFLVKASSGLPHMGTIPPNHRIEYHVVENWIRLVGRNSSGRKIYLKSNKRTYNKKELDREDFEIAYKKYLLENLPFTYQEQEEVMQIPEIPIIVTDDGRIVCLPKTKDNPTIGIFGKKGKGKTFILHRFADCLYHKWNQRVFIGNDGVSFQTRSWSLPWDRDRHGFFIKKLELIGEVSRPLPCVYLTPNTNDLRKIEFENEVGFRISMPFKDIMSDPNSFFEGTKDEMMASEKYLKNMIFDDRGDIKADGLLYTKSLDDIHNLVNEKTWEVQTVMSGKSSITQRREIYKIPESSRAKIFNVLKELYLSKTFDINCEVPSKWVVENKFTEEKYSMYPWDACLFANIVPVLITDNIRTNKYFPSIQRFIMQDIFYRQSRDELIKRNNLEVWYLLDELQSIINKNQLARETFTMINKEARFNRMGIIYAVQYVNDVSESIHLTTDYVISFQQNYDEALKFSKNFNMMEHQKKDLVNLGQYECYIAADAGKPLVVYDTEGRKETITDGTPFKGMIFPSVSQHSAPKEEGI